MKHNKYIFFLLFLFCFVQITIAQDTYFREQEKLLNDLSLTIVQGEADFVRYEANERFLETLIYCLKIEKSFRYPFDSIKAISVLKSDDNKVRIFTWTVPKDDDSYEYFGIVQSYNDKNKNYDIHILTDKSDEITNAENKTLKKDFWYGAIYLDLIQTKYNGRTYYTLLGWDGHTAITNQRIIEVLSIKQNGTPYFGAAIFRGYESRVRRIIFTYSDKSNMLLQYDEQAYYYKTHKFLRKKKRIIKSKTTKMIIFDRLAPIDESLEGEFQFYVPETNIHDAFIPEKGKWRFTPMIDARNPEEDDYTPTENRNHPDDFELYNPE
jgi:hypothetical protein